MIEILEVNNVNIAINTVTYGTDRINSECYHHNSILIIMHVINFLCKKLFFSFPLAIEKCKILYLGEVNNEGSTLLARFN